MSTNSPRRPPPSPSGQPPRRPPIRRGPQPRSGPAPRPQRPLQHGQAPHPQPGQKRPPQGQAPRREASADPFEAFRRKKEATQAARQNPRPQQAPPKQHGAGQHAQQAPKKHLTYEQLQQQLQQEQQQPQQQRRTQRIPQQAQSQAPADSFEAFRKKKAQAQQEKQRRGQDSQRTEQALQNSGWIEGIGPAEENNDPSKPSGFNRGRYSKTTHDPRSLQKPAGFEASKHMSPEEFKANSAEARVINKPRGFTRF